MAVVDAGEDLLHEDGAIALAEFAALKNLVEELAALANLSDQIVSLLVFEELVHFDDVGVVNFFENVDLVEKHALLVVVHVTLAEDLDSALLTYNPEERPSAAQALMHPWITELATLQVDESLAMSALDNLGKFNSDVTLKQATYSFIAS